MYCFYEMTFFPANVFQSNKKWLKTFVRTRHALSEGNSTQMVLNILFFCSLQFFLAIVKKKINLVKVRTNIENKTIVDARVTVIVL